MRILKAMLEAVLKAASKDSGRYNLCSVFFDGGSLVSTDGHRMHRVKLYVDGVDDAPAPDAPVFAPFMLARDAVARLVKSLSAKTSATIASVSEFEERALFTTSDGDTLTGEIVVGEYPNYRQILPSGTPERTVRLNAAYLRDACDAAIKVSKADGDPAAFINIHLRDELGAVHLTTESKAGAGRFDAVIMPVRKD